MLSFYASFPGVVLIGPLLLLLLLSLQLFVVVVVVVVDGKMLKQGTIFSLFPVGVIVFL